MAYELIYTSAEKGLRPGTRGFCTVAHTKGMPPQMVQLLEAMSAYKNLYGVHESQEALEPVAWSHITNNLAGRGASVISRVGPTSPDHTGRSNKLAHHVLIQTRERAKGGPAWLSQQDSFFIDAWNDSPHVIDMPKNIPMGDCQRVPAKAWERLTGDAGNAAILPEAFLENPDSIVLIVFEPGTDMLPLISESMALLEPEMRWKVTYSTYFTALAAGANCSWRCCVADSEALREARRNPRAKVVDLTEALPGGIQGRLADMARNGCVSEPDTPQSPPPQEEPKRKFVLMNNRNVNMLNLKPRKPNI